MEEMKFQVDKSTTLQHEMNLELFGKHRIDGDRPVGGQMRELKVETGKMQTEIQEIR